MHYIQCNACQHTLFLLRLPVRVSCRFFFSVLDRIKRPSVYLSTMTAFHAGLTPAILEFSALLERLQLRLLQWLTPRQETRISFANAFHHTPRIRRISGLKYIFSKKFDLYTSRLERAQIGTSTCTMFQLFVICEPCMVSYNRKHIQYVPLQITRFEVDYFRHRARNYFRH